MHTRSKYKTRQKEIILDYLKSVTGTHITAGDVTRHFKEHGIPVGQATVYRQLENLVEQGMVSKYIIDSNSPACFEYTGADSHQQGASCFHCKCEKCGKLIHLHCDQLEEIQTHLYQEHQFKLDPFRTVFYGLCEQCVSS
ncbi:MAG: transcriptional repressor [Erysipelotrichaceae bacterium]|nr:transcriptional repressor [Erysipelotrichaceae bacterium]